MLDLESIKSNLYALVDDPQDYSQWTAIAMCLVGAIAASIVMKRTLFAKGSVCNRFLARFFNFSKSISSIPAITCFSLWITWSVRNSWSADLVADGYAPLASGYIYTSALLVTASFVYQIATALSKGQSAPRLLGAGMLTIFALHLFGWLEPLSQALRTIRLPLGSIEINLWSIIAAIMAMFLLLWLVGLSTRFIDAVIKPRRDIPPSIKVLIGKATRIVLYLGAIIWALKIGGVPLGGLTVFSGALGLGLGFGLQKVISNLMSGVCLLYTSPSPRDRG